MNIHSLFILNQNGTCLYSRNFTKELKNLDVHLITPFFSAILSFSQKVIERKLEELEMSGLRFTFKVKKDFIFVLLADMTTSLLYLTSRLTKISDAFFTEYISSQDILKNVKEIENPEFDKIIDIIITGEDEIFRSKDFYRIIVDLFKDLLFQNEIIGAALLSTDGKIIYSSLPSEILLSSLKELEIRYMSGTTNLPELFYSLKTGEKVFSAIIYDDSKGISFQIVLMFESSVPLGMAELNLFKIKKKVVKLLKIDQ
ncbi:MAG: hypothetical protein GF353_06735 [Candidatus Lokiarchaeota archaeon]|nr:hypothetical protein [Candidatus Lokiarchaeota archaeon]